MFVKYGGTIASFVAVLFLNSFAACYLIGRKVFLKDTGRKLAHLEKQLRHGTSLLEAEPPLARLIVWTARLNRTDARLMSDPTTVRVCTTTTRGGQIRPSAKNDEMVRLQGNDEP